MPATFSKTSPAPIAFDKALGLCFGWFCFSKQAGVEYDDLHGDHFPDDELVKAVDALMAKPASEREINVEHAGGARGSIATAQAMTEDVAKALKIDTGGNYGILGSFRPDAALLKSILDGERFCLSIEGSASNVEIVKSADGAEVTKARKRIMRGVDLTKLAVVKAGAHEGASVALIKSAAVALKAARLAKACPAMTSAEHGHAHLIADCDEDAGYTSSEPMSGQPNDGWHSHPWLKDEATGAITIGEALGHSHTVTPTDTAETDMPTPADDLAKAQTDLASARAALTKTAALLLVACSLSPEQAAYAKSLSPADRETFLGLADSERIAKAAPIYKAAGGALYFVGEERLAELAKTADAQGVELAKARDAAEVVTFEKAATSTVPHLKGALPEKAALMKAVAGIADEAIRKALTETLKGADAAVAMLCKSVGVNGSGDPVVKSAQDELDGIAAEIAKTKGVTFAKASTLALDTPRGRELYDQIEAAKRR